MTSEAEGDSRRAMVHDVAISLAGNAGLIERRLLDVAAGRGVDPAEPRILKLAF
jgi:hypothetical protein